MSEKPTGSAISFSAQAADLPAALPVPLLDLARQNGPLREEIRTALERVCDSGRFILGPDCEQLEQRLAAYCETSAAIACASGSDALLLALMAVGIGPGDEVLVPSYTFFATASAVTRLGATPVFVDIDPATYNMSPAHLEKSITSAAKAVIPVHLFGQCAEMAAIGRIAQRHGLTVVEDAAQAIGAEYHGRRAGSLGDIGCISFYPTKNLGAFGDGGLLTTNRPALAESLRLLRAHGMQPRYYHRIVGINSRLDTLQAAVLNVKIPYLDQWSAQRRANAQRYCELFTAAGLDRIIALPSEAPGQRHVWNQYVIRVPDDRRDALRKHLTDCRVGTEIYYPLALHQQECFQYLGAPAGSLPHSERAARETLALPIFPELSAAEQQTVVRAVAQFFGVAAGARLQPVPAPHFGRRDAA
jgi:dTDP-4-amino-4,6-dideoxygalactose transaminase